MQVKLVEVAPNRWRVAKSKWPISRSSLPCPAVISDTMPPTEQVDGRFYESKAAFRAVGRSLGLVEVGNEKPQPKMRSTSDRAVKDARRKALRTAAEKFKAGYRTR
jgi:hypothetical protein